ncbi:uncharacterized protein LOC121632513 [Melanotaenia boesemani]|uniref:uncharacterized protein LOC121632513 n=1 Tax=Melanotaenia boesemani TaxID=1250792 RepID=UPI001C05AB97|nr:uncharacterized protein LOC121632513 [Melanotaenia boesemani]
MYVIANTTVMANTTEPIGREIMEEEEDNFIFISEGPDPYSFEPEATNRVTDNQQRRSLTGNRQQIQSWAAENIWRINQTAWCLCGHCQPMSSAEESICCREIPAIWSLVEDLHPQPEGITCVGQHPGFSACCLNPWVLQVAYSAFKQEHGPLDLTQNEQFRYTAYRQMVRWAHGVLGRHVRKPLPACVVSAIRLAFPDEHGVYQGFRWPDL